jgi:hypothetical protein
MAMSCTPSEWQLVRRSAAFMRTLFFSGAVVSAVRTPIFRSMMHGRVYLPPPACSVRAL